MELLISRSNIKSLRFNQSLADQGTRDQCGCEDDVLRHVTVGLGIHVTCKQRIAPCEYNDERDFDLYSFVKGHFLPHERHREADRQEGPTARPACPTNRT